MVSISKRTRETVYINAEGVSDMTGETLGHTWQMDHKVPKAAGGSDDITNLQALTADENRAKSCAQPPELRAWQEEFMDAWRRSTAMSFLLVALPGAGKTIASLAVAKDWLDDNPSRRKVLIVVPTDALRSQWQDEAARQFGIQLQTKEFTSWKTSMVGAVVTYQLLGGCYELWKLRCSQYDFLVICDEIHHASDRNEWGAQLKEGISGAKRRLLTSGTPFRGDCVRIPFVDYDGSGECVANYRYDYPHAIRDGVIRVVRFQHERGIVRKLTAFGEESVELSSDLPDDQANDTLGQILKPGKYTEELLRLAHAQLLQCRSAMPNAAALAICKDQEHAQQIAQQLHRITGTAPDLVVSDDDRATSTVEAFRSSQRPWVVAVRQISEGVDIKRLMVLAYLTNYRTALFFRQAVGRIVRNIGTPDDMEAYCFIPDHPVLVQHAQNITTAQSQAILDEPVDEFDRSINRVFQGSLLQDIVLGTEHTGSAGTIIEGQALTPAIAAKIHALAVELECTERVALRVMNKFGLTAATITTPTDGMRGRQRPLERQTDDARGALDKAIKRAAFVLFSDDDPQRFAKVQQLVNRHIGKKRQDFSLEECHSAIVHLKKLSRGES